MNENLCILWYENGYCILIWPNKLYIWWFYFLFKRKKWNKVVQEFWEFYPTKTLKLIISREPTYKHIINYKVPKDIYIVTNKAHTTRRKNLLWRSNCNHPTTKQIIKNKTHLSSIPYSQPTWSPLHSICIMEWVMVWTHLAQVEVTIRACGISICGATLPWQNLQHIVTTL